MSQAAFESDARAFLPRRVAGRAFPLSRPAARRRLARDPRGTHARGPRRGDGRLPTSGPGAPGRTAATPRPSLPVTRPDGVRVERDELVRPGLTAGDLARFPAAFAPLGALGAEAFVNAADPALGGLRYLHAVPHCPPMADGAALVLLGTRERAAEFGLMPRARLAAVVEVNTDPLDPFAAGFAALDRVLPAPASRSRTSAPSSSWRPSPRCRPRSSVAIPRAAERANESGGHLAMGHPMGASGRDPRGDPARRDGAQGRRVGRGRGARRVGRGRCGAAAARLIRPARARAPA